MNDDPWMVHKLGGGAESVLSVPLTRTAGTAAAGGVEV